MYGTEVMSSYSDVTVNALEKLSLSKHGILYTVGKKIWRWSIFLKGLGVEKGYNVQWRHS